MTLEAYSSIRKNRFLNILEQGLPGSGKTRLISDFPNPVLIDFDQGDLTIQALGRKIPVLRPKNEDQIRAIIEDPEMVIEKVIQPTKDDEGKHPFSDYIPETWGFDTFSTMQDLIMGEGPRKEVDLGEGVILDKKAATGILALPASRENASLPVWKDFNVFNARMRKMALNIKQMKYHTILAVHTAPSDQVATIKDGWPMMVGQLRYQLGGLADFFLHLKKDIYTIETQKIGIFHARNRIEHLLKDRIQWKEKNAFDILNEPLQKALEQVSN